MELIEKYKNISNIEFVPLDCLGEDFNGLYSINKLGHLKTLSTNNIRKDPKIDNQGYPIFSLFNKKGNTRVFRVHSLIAKMFISNPNNYPVVDHIDRNRQNYSLNNLRWVTYKENNKNKTFIESRNIIYAKLNDNLEEIGRISSSKINRKELSSITRAIIYNKKYLGVYWKRIYPDVENYINLFGEPKEEDWKECLRDNYFEINKNGLFRIKKNKRIILGSNTRGYWWVSRRKDGIRVTYPAHRLICETFLGRLLSEDEVVDHINTNPLDNRLCNLRVCSQTDNMNNPVTKQKISIPVLKYSLTGVFIEKYLSIREASLSMGMVKIWTKGIEHGYITENFILCKESDNIFEILKRIVFKYDNTGNIIKTYKYISSAEKDSTSDLETIKRYLNTGKICTDGFIYYLGPHEFSEEEKIKLNKQIVESYIYKYDRCYNLIKTFNSISETSKEDNINRNTLTHHISTGKICANGFYYSKGPREF